MTSILELQVKSEDYDIIKLYSDYHSDITKVCSLSSLGVKKIKEMHPGVLERNLNKDQSDSLKDKVKNPMVSVEDGKIFVRNGNIEILSFLEVRSLSNPEMKIVNLWKMFLLLEQGVLVADKSFKELMTPLNENSKISELFSSTGKMRFRNKLWSLGDNFGEEPISFLEFEKQESIEKKYRTLKSLKVLKFFPESKTVSLQREGSNMAYTAKFFYMTPNMVQVMQEGRYVNLSSERAYGKSNDDFKLINPMILPDGCEIKTVSNLKCSRVYPSAIYNAAHKEYEYRRSISE